MTESSIDNAPLIAHLVFSLETGGLENGLVNLINRSSKYNFRHIVICLTTSGAFSRRITQNNVDIVELKKPDGHSLSTLIKLRKLIKQCRPSIVHSRNLAALEYQIATLGLPGIKRIHGEHGRDINDPHGKNWKYNLLRRFSPLWIDRYITVSRELELWLSECIGISSNVITCQANGVDCDIFSEKSNQRKTTLTTKENSLDIVDCYVIGTVGRLAAIKDQESLIAAFAKVVAILNREKKQLCLLIVGDGPLRKHLEDYAKTLGVLHFVRFCGNRDDVSDLLKIMDVFVLPSIAEGVSNTLLEAMATGLPVIATAVGGAPDIINSGINGFLVNVGNREEIANRLIACFVDRNRAYTIGCNGRETVKRYYNWSDAIENYYQIYRDLTADKIFGKTLSN